MTKALLANRLIAALDTADAAAGVDLARRLSGAVGAVKLGKEFFTANGPQGVRAVALAGLPVFLDLKFHDIPHTVAGAVRAAAPLSPAMLTVHAAGGPAMLRAAVDAAGEAAATAGQARPLVLGVTVLTSLGEDDLPAIGVAGTVADQVLRLAALAQGCGLDGVVCAPDEIEALRARCGPDFALVTPGIRAAGAPGDDQKRSAAAAEAVRRGADYLVVGRPITRAADPAAAARALASEMAEAGA